MEHTFEVKGGDLIVTVTSSKAELQDIYGKAVAALAQQVTVKGFRKGKAPLKLAAPLVEPSAIDDRFTRKLIDAAFRSYLADAKIVAALDENAPERAVPAVDLPEPKDGSKVTFTYPLKPQVAKLAPYTKLKSGVTAKKIGDREVQAELERLAKDLADLVPVSEPIANGNYANCDIKGFINGIESPTLSEKALDIVVGAKKFIPGFEEKLLGHKAGEDVRIEAVLPANYPEEVAGKKASFSVRINSVKKEELPAIDDELATTQETYPQAKDLADLKAKAKKALTDKAAKEFRDAKFAALMAKVIDGSEFTVDDPRLKALLVENQRKEDEKALAQQGLDLSTYLRLVNMDKKTYENNVYANLSARLKAQAVEAAIFKAVKLPEPTAAELAEVAKKGGIADFKAFQADLAKQYLAHNKKAAKDEAELFVAQQVAPIREQAVLDKVVGFVLANND